MSHAHSVTLAGTFRLNVTGFARDLDVNGETSMNVYRIKREEVKAS